MDYKIIKIPVITGLATTSTIFLSGVVFGLKYPDHRYDWRDIAFVDLIISSLFFSSFLNIFSIFPVIVARLSLQFAALKLSKGSQLNQPLFLIQM